MMSLGGAQKIEANSAITHTASHNYLAPGPMSSVPDGTHYDARLAPHSMNEVSLAPSAPPLHRQLSIPYLLSTPK